MNEKKLRGAIGLARKAGKLALGDRAVRESVLTGRTVLVLAESSASEGTKKRMRYLCENMSTEFYEIRTEEPLSHSVGRDTVKLFAVCDEGFGRLIESTIKEGTE